MILNHFFKIVLLITLTLFVIIPLAVAAQRVDTTAVSVVEPVTISLKTYVESNKVPLDRKVEFNVELSWIGELSRFHIDPLEQPALTNLVMEGSGSANKLEPLADGRFRAVKTIMYQFTPLELGMAYINGMVIKYRDQITGEEDQLISQRVQVEIIDPVSRGNGSGFRAIIYIILLIIFFGSMIFFIIKYIQKRRRAAIAVPIKVCLPQEYLNRISQEIDPNNTNLAEMTIKLSSFFREYLSRDFQILAREGSTQEIVENLSSKDIHQADMEKLKNLFEKLDLVKFAGENIDPAEFSNIYGTIETFLLNQKKIWDEQQLEVKDK
jgi:hypothetical protein